MPFYLMVGIPYGVINLWILSWFWRALRGTGFIQIAVCLGLMFLALCFPLFYRRPGDSTLALALLRLGSLWTGVFLYIFFMVLLDDGAVLLMRLAGKAPAVGPRWTACGLITALAFGIGLASWINAAHPVLREYRLTFKKPQAADWPSGSSLTIAAISDTHLGRLVSASRFAEAIDLVAPHKPDLALFLGDILDDHSLLDIEAMRRAVARLMPPLGTWGVVGNHEYIAGDVDASIEILERCGIRVLRDRWAVPGGEDLDSAGNPSGIPGYEAGKTARFPSLLLVGRDDYSAKRFGGKDRKSLEEILADVPKAARRAPLLLMDHQPHHLEMAEQAGAALQLSGHTHYAQLWPFHMLLQRFYENARGYSQRGDTQYIVSVGAGTWGPPMRNTARPEVLLIRLAFEDAPE